MNRRRPSSQTRPQISRFFTKATLLAFLVLALTNKGHAGSGTWVGRDPGNPYAWEYERNWDPNTIPETKDDVATFGVSSRTVIFIGAGTNAIDPGTMVFNPGSSAYTFIPEGSGLTLTKDGIINNSGVTQTFQVSVGSSVIFEGRASAGSQTLFTPERYLADTGQVVFYDDSTAAQSNLTVSGQVLFYDHSTANEATCEALGGTEGGGGKISFYENTRADQAILIADAGESPNDDAGYIFFDDWSQGDDDQVILGGGDPGTVPGQLDISYRASDSKDVSIGSLEGVGNVTLAQRYNTFAANLIVGKNNLSTTFAGVIWYGYYFLNDGALTKIGKGTLTLTGANLHRGGTIVKRGTLLVNNTTGSGTGTGPVSVEGGSLGGTGIIAGAVNIGGGTGHEASLAPGSARRSSLPLTIQRSLLFNSDATLRIRMNSNTGTAASVVANGVTIDNAQFSLTDTGKTLLSTGTAFTIINNTAATPIAGPFADLPDGSTLAVGLNTFQVSYEGGDGNDLTLTVVP